MLQYEHLNQNDLSTTIKKNTVSEDTLTNPVHKVRPYSKLVNDVLKDDGIMNDDIIGFTDTSIWQILFAK